MSALAGHIGWWFPNPWITNRTAHWSGPDGRTLCEKYTAVPALMGAAQFDTDPEPQGRECKACRTKLDKIRSAA